MAEAAELRERLYAISRLIDPLTDTPGDNSLVARAIEKIAKGTATPREAVAALGADWADVLADLTRQADPARVVTGTPQPPTAPYLDVNVTHLLARGDRATAAWWSLYREDDPAGRITTAQPGLPGDRVRIACGSRADAARLRTLFLERGVPDAALKVVNGR